MSSKNYPKQTSYAYAYRQMKHAIDQECFIEAVSIQESMISDRLESFLHGVGVDTNRKMLAGLTHELENSIKDKKCGDLEHEIIKDLDGWRYERNFIVHAIVKSKPGEKPVPVDEFMARAKAAALRGRRLTNKIKTWHRRQLRTHRRATKLKN